MAKRRRRWLQVLKPLSPRAKLVIGCLSFLLPILLWCIVSYVPFVWHPQVLITEVTFFETAHRAKAKVGKHLHLDHFVELLPKMKNEHIVLAHVSRRTGVRKARRLLARRIPPEQMQRIHFLMDFEGARDEGEVEDQAPPPPDTAE